MERYTKPTLSEIEMLERIIFCGDSAAEDSQHEGSGGGEGDVFGDDENPVKSAVNKVMGFFKGKNDEQTVGFTDPENTSNVDESGLNTSEEEILNEAKELNEEPNKGILEELFSGGDNDNYSGSNELIIEEPKVDTPIDNTNTDGGF